MSVRGRKQQKQLKNFLSYNDRFVAWSGRCSFSPSPHGAFKGHTRDGRADGETPIFAPIGRERCDVRRLPRLLRPRQQQGEELGAALAVDDSVDEVGPEAALECDHRLLRVGDVIAEALEREQET